MGTNMRWHPRLLRTSVNPLGMPLYPDSDDMDPARHLGKRSAAGLFCYDCDVTLYRYGTDRIHEEPPDVPPRGDLGVRLKAYAAAWYDRCPRCGQAPAEEPLHTSAAGVELGFAKPRRVRPTGVRSCASFSWAQPPEEVRAVCRQFPRRKLVVDEYGRTYTGREFLRMLAANCPIEYTRSLGKWFS